jgi:2-O-methyltransferase
VSLPFAAIERYFGNTGPKVIADIGAADGLDTIAYALRFPQARVHAFEPLARNVATLVESIQRAGIADRVTVVKCALGERLALAAPFWVSAGSPPGWPKSWAYSSSLREPDQHTKIHPWCTFTADVADVHRLDEYDVIPDYVHMDVQGAELDVLRGAGERLNAIRAVWMEVSTVALYKGQPLYHDVSVFMHAGGFKCALDTALGEPSGDQLWIR